MAQHRAEPVSYTHLDVYKRQIHGGAAADGNDAVRLRSLKCGHAVLHIGDGGVGLDIAVHAVRCV